VYDVALTILQKKKYFFKMRMILYKQHMAQDTVHENNQHQTKTQRIKGKKKEEQSKPYKKKGDEPICSQRVKSVPVSYIM
jgi:hypothetical protein